MNVRTYLLLAAVLVGVSATAAEAQSVNINATKQEVLSLTLSAATLTNTDLAASSTIGSLTATLGWTLSPSRNTVVLAGYFSTAEALSDGAGNSIAHADFAGSCTSSSLASPLLCSAAAEAFNTANATLGTAGGSRILWASPTINGTNRIVTGATVGLNFVVAPSAIANLPAGTYSGVLNLRAYAQ